MFLSLLNTIISVLQTPHDDYQSIDYAPAVGATKSTKPSLDANHSHFVLVDSGVDSKYVQINCAVAYIYAWHTHECTMNEVPSF